MIPKAYVASSNDTYVWISASGIPSRECNEKGRTGTITLYKNISLHTASVMTDSIVRFDERKRKNIGNEGGDEDIIVWRL